MGEEMKEERKEDPQSKIREQKEYYERKAAEIAQNLSPQQELFGEQMAAELFNLLIVDLRPERLEVLVNRDLQR